MMGDFSCFGWAMGVTGRMGDGREWVMGKVTCWRSRRRVQGAPHEEHADIQKTIGSFRHHPSRAPWRGQYKYSALQSAIQVPVFLVAAFVLARVAALLGHRFHTDFRSFRFLLSSVLTFAFWSVATSLLSQYPQSAQIQMGRLA